MPACLTTLIKFAEPKERFAASREPSGPSQRSSEAATSSQAALDQRTGGFARWLQLCHV